MLHSSSGELSDSQGFNNFLNAKLKNEDNYLPKYNFKSNLAPNNSQGNNYGKTTGMRGDMMYGQNQNLNMGMGMAAYDEVISFI